MEQKGRGQTIQTIEQTGSVQGFNDNMKVLNQDGQGSKPGRQFEQTNFKVLAKGSSVWISQKVRQIKVSGSRVTGNKVQDIRCSKEMGRRTDLASDWEKRLACVWTG